MIIAELIEDASVEFSFDNLTSKGTSVSGTYFTNKYTDTLLSDIMISGSVYDGNGSGSTNYANTTGLIKFGSSSATGELKFVFNENVLIKTIIIYAAGWNASEGQLRVNGNNPAGESNLADIETRYVIVLDEATNEITIETSSGRAFLFAVGFYGPEAEVPAAPVITEWVVSFDLGYDGSPVMEPVIVEDEKAVNEPSKPSREGYTFKGWFRGENEFDFDTLITEAITLTAHWEEAEPVVEYTITFYDDEGILLETLVVVEGEMPSPQTPTKAETATHKFEFDGWDPELVVASEEAIYHATFKATEKGLYDYTETFTVKIEYLGDQIQTAIPDGSLSSYLTYTQIDNGIINPLVNWDGTDAQTKSIFNNGSSETRLYKGGKLNISVENAKISKIEWTSSQNDGATIGGEATTDLNGSKEFAELVDSVEIVATVKQFRIGTITITYVTTP
ncbi:MAG: InlB B-repeat-containing protein [Acholeplasmataceae bacterium]